MEFFSKHFPIRNDVKSPDVTKYVQPIVCFEPDNNNVIQLFDYIIATIRYLNIPHNYYDLTNKGFTAFKVM